MTIVLSSYLAVLVLDEAQVDAAYIGEWEPPGAALDSEWADLRDEAHNSVFGSLIDDIPTDFYGAFQPPTTQLEAVAFADRYDFLLINRTAPLRDWFWWSVLVGACVAGLTARTPTEIEAEWERRAAERLGVDNSWLGANRRWRRNGP